MNRFNFRLLVELSFIFVVSLLVGCKGGEQKAAPSKQGGPGAGGGGNANLPAKQVKLGNSEARKLVRTVIAPGTLAADQEATLSFKVAGRISDIRVDLGSVVKNKQPIAQLETTDFKGRVAQAEAALQQARVRIGLAPEGTDDRIEAEKTGTVRQARALLEEARSNRERAIQLVNQGIQSRAELDRVDSTFKVADSRFQDAIEEVRNRQAVLLQRRSELALARQQLAETTLYASFDGAVKERRASLGEYLVAGAPVVTIVRLHPLRMRIEVPEREAQGIRVGQSVRVVVEGEETQNYAGRVARLSPSFQEQSRTLVIEAEVNNQQGRLRPGSFAKAEIQTAATTDVITVPTSAIVTFAGIQKVFTVKDGKALEKNVIVGKREDDWAVVEGIDPGIPVVLSPGNLISGQPVSTVR